jgi:hypothetical protein
MFETGILGLLASPFVLLVLLGVGFVIFIVGVVIVVAYGLENAIAFLIVSGAFILILAMLKVIDLQKQPLFLAIPFLFFMIGYGTQHLNILSMASTSQATLSSQSVLALQLIFVAIFSSLGTLVVVRQRQKHR